LRPTLPKAVAGSEIYGFVDGARLAVVPRLTQPAMRFTLASAGIGLRLAYRDTGSFDIEAARAIDDPYPSYRGRWRLNLGWRLSFHRR